MGFQHLLLAWKSTLVRNSQPIWGIVPKDLHPTAIIEVLNQCRRPRGTAADNKNSPTIRRLYLQSFTRYYRIIRIGL